MGWGVLKSSGDHDTFINPFDNTDESDANGTVALDDPLQPGPARSGFSGASGLSVYTITGGAGFIGSHLADRLLAEGHRVRVLDDLSTGKRANLDPRCVFIHGDVTDPGAVGQALQGADGCYHLAAIASVERANQDWLGTHRVNQGGTIVVLDQARRLGGIPVVYASSAAVYGDVGQRAQEALRPAPLTAYGADKLGSELHARVAFVVHGVPSLGLRFFNVYGPRQDPQSPYSGVISIFAGLAATDQPITVHGDGAQTRDFVYVADVVDHLVAAMRKVRQVPGAAVANVCTGLGISVLDLARTLLSLQGQQPTRIVHGPDRTGDIRHSVGDPAIAEAMLGLRARISLKDGLTRTLASVAETVAPAPAGC